MLNTTFFLKRLASFKSVLPAMTQQLSDEESRWKPPSGNWSVLEIVCHLVEEEVNDFRVRLKSTLENPGKDWIPIDPENTVIQEKFNQRDLNESIKIFVDERTRSLEWLQSLNEANNLDWNQAYQHPNLGPIKAGDLLASWVAHDQLHTRQIAKRIFELTMQQAPAFSIHYAGDLN